MSNRMEETLRTAIRKRAESESLHAIAQGSGVPHPSLYRFLTGERSLKFESVAKLSDYLGLELNPRAEVENGDAPPKRPGRKKKAT